MKKIELVDLKAQQDKIGDKIQKAIARVLSHGRYIMGPEVNEFEQKLVDFTGADYAISCASGTDALLLALMSIGVGPGDAVFTTPFTFIATAEVIRLLGAVPVFVDIDSHTFSIDPDKLKKKIQKISTEKQLRPSCIIPVDIFGLPADYPFINKLTDEYGLPIIADGAQSLGSQINDKMACSLTEIATTSFFPAKPLGCYGDGGAVFTKNPELHEKIISMRVHGMGTNKYDNVRIGINGRLDTLQAAILLEKLKIFKGELKQREAIAHKYRSVLGNCVTCQRIPEGYKSSWAQFSFVSIFKTKIKKKLEKYNIPTAVYYPKPLHLQKAFSDLGYKPGDFPVSEAISDSILSVPMHPYLLDDQIDMVTQTIRDGLN